MMLIGLGVLAMMPNLLLFTGILWLVLAMGWMPATFLGCLALAGALALGNFFVSVFSQLGILQSLVPNNFQTV